MQIYFYTVKPILPNQELLVWYCKEFAERLNYPLTGEIMLQKIRKSDIFYKFCIHIRISALDGSENYTWLSLLFAGQQTTEPEPMRGPNSPAEHHSGGKEASLPSPSGKAEYEVSHGQLTPPAPDGSVRSDEGYHSHGYHDDPALTPPEDSSDSDYDNNYVLDFR
jgi:hypothetical protein